MRERGMGNVLQKSWLHRSEYFQYTKWFGEIFDGLCVSVCMWARETDREREKEREREVAGNGRCVYLQCGENDNVK